MRANPVVGRMFFPPEARAQLTKLLQLHSVLRGGANGSTGIRSGSYFGLQALESAPRKTAARNHRAGASGAQTFL